MGLAVGVGEGGAVLAEDDHVGGGAEVGAQVAQGLAGGRLFQAEGEGDGLAGVDVTRALQGHPHPAGEAGGGEHLGGPVDAQGAAATGADAHVAHGQRVPQEHGLGGGALATGALELGEEEVVARRGEDDVEGELARGARGLGVDVLEAAAGPRAPRPGGPTARG